MNKNVINMKKLNKNFIYKKNKMNNIKNNKKKNKKNFYSLFFQTFFLCL